MSEKKLKGPLVFFALTFGLAWLVWIPLAAFSPPTPILIPALLVGAFAPSLVGIGLTQLTGSREEKRDYWNRALSFKRISARGYALILVLFPALMALTLAFDRLLGGSPPSLESARQVVSEPLSLLSFLVLMLLGGALAEEFGWRGYALDRLLAKWNSLTASLVLGVAWGAWHLPLFFIAGTSQGDMGFGTADYWVWFGMVVALAVIYTWVYENNRRSTLSAILLHFVSNATFTLVAGLGNALPAQTFTINAALHGALALVIAAGWSLQGTAMRSAPDKKLAAPR